MRLGHIATSHMTLARQHLTDLIQGGVVPGTFLQRAPKSPGGLLLTAREQQHWRLQRCLAPFWFFLPWQLLFAQQLIYSK